MNIMAGSHEYEMIDNVIYQGNKARHKSETSKRDTKARHQARYQSERTKRDIKAREQSEQRVGVGLGSAARWREASFCTKGIKESRLKVAIISPS